MSSGERRSPSYSGRINGGEAASFTSRDDGGVERITLRWLTAAKKLRRRFLRDHEFESASGTTIFGGGNLDSLVRVSGKHVAQITLRRPALLVFFGLILTRALGPRRQNRLPGGPPSPPATVRHPSQTAFRRSKLRRRSSKVTSKQWVWLQIRLGAAILVVLVRQCDPPVGFGAVSGDRATSRGGPSSSRRLSLYLTLWSRA